MKRYSSSQFDDELIEKGDFPNFWLDKNDKPIDTQDFIMPVYDKFERMIGGNIKKANFKQRTVQVDIAGIECTVNSPIYTNGTPIVDDLLDGSETVQNFKDKHNITVDINRFTDVKVIKGKDNG